MQFTFVGEVAEDFPSLAFGHTLQPGEVVELEKDPNHPRLVRVKDAPKKADPKEID